MAESVIIRQNNRFEFEVLAQDPHDHSDHFHPAESLYHLTPYGMWLAGLGTCTAIVLHTYAQNHGLDLQEVELHLHYDRVFAEDCEQCESAQRYTEEVNEGIKLVGNLTSAERQKLLAISRHCPIHKMLEHGIEIKSRLEQE
jgi:putative redox protein